ncbi:Pyruvate/2-oxoglutarate dehydrogenase complex, dihydrolipoamide dehydrogenase (E3) component [Glycomyces sambucus]|uniref:Pyruvate/2-oxoglutarate dehydrogenase complex, dihydrolipoamide dehydrogenase (E3) component n=1 Tax=Glycomyces sambucus TaxID=380244 RepID=A0A1G9E270_9ACTN|nr:NAD(P)/FAD-dependent oxidoreductase [Glycomyces sambucus]SDK70231.1 Pyruvate/2-oxoglutarate dehydrogenase complex, dihydrolipoamide dehydrogenase (E3) component [Glycomyces sambucus]
MAEQVDVVVVGMGPGGESAAAELARAGLVVVGVERRLVGGECPYYGCIPTKMMVRGSDALAEARRVADLAGTAEVTPDFAPVAQRIRGEATDDWDDQVAADRFTDAGGRLVRGEAVITGPGAVRVGDREFTVAKAIILNTGTEPAVPPITGLADTPFWTNRDAVAATEAPDSLIVLGGGAIGLEMAQAFSRFGTHVTVFEAADRLLALEEPESGELVEKVFREEGIAVHTGASVESVSHEDGRFAVTAGTVTVEADRLLVATGRRPNIRDLGLDTVGVDASGRSLDADEHLRVADGVYAIGDIVGKGAFTHMSMYQAAIVADHVLGKDNAGAEYHAVPRVTFTDPEVGAVGLTEQQARDQGLNVATSVSEIPSSSRGWIHKTGNEGFIKLVADTDKGVLVGATSAGPTGGEVLSMLTLAVHERTPIANLRRMIYAYPTFHRAVEDALSRL